MANIYNNEGQVEAQTKSNVDEITELLAFSTVSHSNFRHRAFKASPLMTKNKEETQEERRRCALEEQQRRRRDLTDHARNLALFKLVEGSDEESDGADDKNTEEQMVIELNQDLDKEILAPKKNERKFKTRGGKRRSKGKNPYRNQIMHAEWMIEIPNDLELNWFVVVCPVGKRCLVTTARGKTVSRSRGGYKLDVFESSLPAGSSVYQGNKTSDFCILDCIYDQTTLTYYVLDLMCWKGHPFYDCDTEFRFYWLHSKLSEMDSPRQEISKFTFKPLVVYLCNQEQFAPLIANPYQFEYRPDGLLFFNKKTHYVIGDTPLCSWVGIENIAEVFGKQMQK